MTAAEPRTRWSLLLLLALAMVGLEWLVERRAESAARDAALLAADAAADAARIQIDARGPRESRGEGWQVNGAPLDLSRIAQVGGFELGLSTDASACPIPNAESEVLGSRATARGYVQMRGQWWVVRCDPMLDRHGQVGGLMAVAAPARGFAGNPWRVRAVLVPSLVALFGLAAAGFMRDRSTRRALWEAERRIDEQQSRNDASAALLRERDEALLSESSLVEAALSDAEAATRERTSFLANVSHELRTPLNAVIGYGELLQDEVAPQHREDVRRLLSAARGLVDTISEILDLTQLEAGTLELGLQAFDLRSLLEEIAQVSTSRLAHRGNTLRLEVDPGIDWMVSDPGQHRRLLENLLLNANGLTENGEIVLLTYPVEGEGGTERVAFQMTDAGVGMDEQALARVFEPFGLTGSSSGSRDTGTGVGLTIVQRLAEWMGGDVSASSTPGVGTTFTVVLPKELQLGQESIVHPPPAVQGEPPRGGTGGPRRFDA